MRTRDTSRLEPGQRRGMSHLIHVAPPMVAAAVLAAILWPAPAASQGFQVNAEAAAALWLDKPQADRFGPGFYGAIRPGVSLGRGIFALQASYAALAFTAGDGADGMGVGHFIGGGFRLRPFATLSPPEKQLGGLFVDFNTSYVRTDDLDRLGLDTGLGFNIQASPVFAVGPVVRYVHILQPNDIDGVDSNDAQLLTVGLNFSFGSAHREPEPFRCPDCPEMEPTAVPECPAVSVCPPGSTSQCVPDGCPDYDGDGVCDDVDRCPMQAGPSATFGCPVDPCTGEPLVVLVQFEYDSFTMPERRSTEIQTMDPVLDAVAAAIAQDPTCRVCIIGFASEEGAAEYNQTLSSERAHAVQNYMSNRGVSETRIPAIGMGEMCPLVPVASNIMNRRVEFRRLEEGESCQTECGP